MTLTKRILCAALFGALTAALAVALCSKAQAQATGVGITPGSGAVNACVFSVTGPLKAPCVVMVDPVSGATIVTTNGTPATSLLGVQGASNGVPLPVTGAFFQATQPMSAASLPLPTGAATAANQLPSSSSSAAASACTSTALETSHICKASAGNLYGFYCNVTGGAAGFCIVYNSTTVPSTGALTGAQVLDNCAFAAGAMGCSLDRIPIPRQYGTGIVILVSSAVTPFTYTTGTDTAYISADYQ